MDAVTQHLALQLATLTNALGRLNHLDQISAQFEDKERRRVLRHDAGHTVMSDRTAAAASDADSELSVDEVDKSLERVLQECDD